MYAGTDGNPYVDGQRAQMQQNLLNFSGGAVGGSPDVFVYSGNEYSITQKLSQLTPEELGKIKSFRINISGNQIKAANVGCYCATIVFGSIILFPFFFMCCSWWQRMVNVVFSIGPNAYQQIMMTCKQTGATELYLNVQDNQFDKAKAQVLIDGIQQCQIKNFVFSNQAQCFDSIGSNFSDFDVYMKPIKSVTAFSNISWGAKIVL